MYRLTLTTIDRKYRNAGQEAERVFAFTVTGEDRKADNRPHTMCGDVLDIQVKSARATVCKGTDVDAYLALDAAERFAYVTADFACAFIMNRTEYRAFVERFAVVTRESDKNGGSAKLRLGHETRAMLAWFMERV